jgi:hypothetical protein
MAQEFKRNLSAILNADVKVYIRSMVEDEAASVSVLEEYKQIISDLIKQSRR